MTTVDTSRTFSFSGKSGICSQLSQKEVEPFSVAITFLPVEDSICIFLLCEHVDTQHPLASLSHLWPAGCIEAGRGNAKYFPRSQAAFLVIVLLDLLM